ncbi:MAG: hypothetical protein KAV87_02220 [Desulfobacteraceae bacterium]|nr:hypothetical protein [Desulfobacteraceae bacterium]
MADIRKPLNVFAQGVVAGQIAEVNAAGPASQTTMLISTSAETILPTYPLKLVTGVGNVPQVELATPGTDPIYGLAIFNPKQSSWTAKDLFQLTTKFTVIHLKSDEILSRGAKVGMATSAPFELIAATSSNYIGQLLDDAVVDQIVRVELAIPLTVAP